MITRLTAVGTCDWVEHHLFEEYEFGSRGNGFSRWNTPEGFPRGLLWEYRRLNNNPRGKILAVRCIGFDPDYNPDIRDEIRSDIRRMFRDAPCLITALLHLSRLITGLAISVIHCTNQL